MNTMQPKAANQNFRKTALRLAAAPLALVLGLGQVMPAYATMDNTVTVSGTGPGAAPVSDTDTVQVDVEDAAPSVLISKTTTFPTNGDTDSDGYADPGETIAYSYTVTNNGNVTLTNVGMTDSHQGAGTLTPGTFPTLLAGYTDGGATGGSSDTVIDTVWDQLGPGDTITFTATYTVVAADATNNGGGDGDIDNTATASGSFGGDAYDNTDSVEVLLDVAPRMTVAKIASDTTNVVLDQVITYTYTVTNTGNVPITGVTLSDDHGGSGPAPVPAFSSWTAQAGSTPNLPTTTIDILNPGAIAVFTATYTVTQSDIDTLQ